MFRVKQSGQLEAHDSSCKPCPVAASSPVCGSDGHNYASEVKERKKYSLPASFFESIHSTFYLNMFSFAFWLEKQHKNPKKEMETARVIVFK